MAFQLDTLMQLQLSLNKGDVTHIVVYLCGCEGQLNFTRNKQHRWMPIILYHTHHKDPGHLQQLYLSFQSYWMLVTGRLMPLNTWCSPSIWSLEFTRLSRWSTVVFSVRKTLIYNYELFAIHLVKHSGACTWALKKPMTIVSSPRARR